jgi:serine phosphatase RsbU (regulator of sigma subunit)
MLSVVCSNAINRTVKELKIMEPAKILDKTRQLFLESFAKNDSDFKEGMDISFCLLNRENNQLFWSGAQNPVWYISNNRLHEIKGDKQSIGNTFEPKPFTSHKIDLQKGDVFYIFTDGYADQFSGKNGKKLMKKQLKEILLQMQHLEMNEQKTYLSEYLENWSAGAEQVDDILIIGVKV